MSFEYTNTWQEPKQETIIKISLNAFEKIKREPFWHYMSHSCSVCGKDANMSYPGIDGEMYCNDHLEMKIIGEYFWLCRE